jgi:UDP-N-acetylmuramoyl-tripeptide--D-alanyl-D-alanine ligase
MSALWTLRRLRRRPEAPCTATFRGGVAFDSREIGPGDLFIAMKGEATDGHKFLDRAFAAGRPARSCRKRSHSRTSVSRTHSKRLNDLGRAPAPAAARGSAASPARSAKTGTKEALFAALERSARGRAHRR